MGRAGTQTSRLSHCFPWWLCCIASFGTDVPHGIWKTRTLFLHSLLLQIPCIGNSRGRVWLIHVKLEIHTGPKCCRHGVGKSSGIWDFEKNIYQKGWGGQWLQTLVKEHLYFLEVTRGREGYSLWRQSAMGSSLYSAILTASPWTRCLASLNQIFSVLVLQMIRIIDKNNISPTTLIRGLHRGKRRVGTQPVSSVICQEQPLGQSQEWWKLIPLSIQ